jgi:hypothetical protein
MVAITRSTSAPSAPTQMITTDPLLRRVVTEAESRLNNPRKRSPHHTQYHHIPCSAALDFSRTATPDASKQNKASMHKPLRHHHHHVKFEMHVTYPRRPPPQYLEDLTLFDQKRGGGYVSIERNVRRRASVVSAQSYGRPDWTERDECGDGDSALWAFLKRSASVLNFRHAAAAERTIMPSVREEDNASIRTGEGYGWSCVCFAR